MALTRDDFEYWLFAMDQQLSRFLARVPSKLSKKLDFSVSSLSHLEQWLLESYPTVEDVLNDSEKENLDQLSRYVGETIRKNLGGVWNIDLKHKRNLYFGIPVVVRKGIWTECPVSNVTAAIDRQAGDYLEKVVRSMMEDYGKRP